MKNILEWLEASALVKGDAPSASDIEHTLSFVQLRDRAQKAGTFLYHAGVRKGKPVAIFAEKSTDVLCGMLGAVYAGGFYCLLDTRQPKERMERMLEKLQPVCILSDGEHREEAEQRFAGMPLYMLEDILEQTEIEEEILAQVRMQAQDTDPLYVNFTSGSTGIPKGVAVSHRSVIDFIPRFVSTFGITGDDILGNQAPFDFDVSVKDIFTMLYCGAHMQMIPRAYFSKPADLMDLLYERHVTVLTWAVSALCFVSIMNGLDYKTPETVRMVLFSGEIMPVKHLSKWKKYLPDVRYINLYGPTEITCNCTWHEVNDDDMASGVIPIGRPFDNERVFLLDENDALVEEADKDGEICVAGTCLALGYWRDAHATEAAFVKNPCNSDYEERIYRTGDLGYYNENGELVYRGRKDHQIKHLGHRIELGEIEMLVQKEAGAVQAVCLYDEKKKRILLYYSGETDAKTLGTRLKTVLPAYMCPSKITQKDYLPLNKNGKIDRNALKKEAGLA
ncbi:MAG: amino acid adenylation domain-containing protein [Solobacterium sp.]|nr:amino acid adenylation domain-containing protein [Solobacterium sp.]